MNYNDDSADGKSFKTLLHLADQFTPEEQLALSIVSLLFIIGVAVRLWLTLH